MVIEHQETIAALQLAARPLAGLDDVGPVLEEIGDATLVLLGEATHGTHEFYKLRAEISKRLIADRGFDAIAVEADWPDALRISRYIQGAADIANVDSALDGFARFPLWMWRNLETRELVQWLRDFNDALDHDALDPAGGRPKVGFYGLDLYSLGTSIRSVVHFLEQTDPDAAAEARRRYACFDDLLRQPQQYGLAARFGLTPDCEQQVVEQLRDLFNQAGQRARNNGHTVSDELFYAQQNARVIRNAEQYYRIMFEGRMESWNLRDSHMAETLEHLRNHLTTRCGHPAKIIVWAHNSHIGDARATDSSRHGQLNLGQLVREWSSFAGETFLLGFTTHTGTVAAASDWDEPVELKRIVPSLSGSVEHLLHRTALSSFLLPLRRAARQPLAASYLQRAIGVIYRPDTERVSHYFYAVPSAQFDALVHIDETRALTPVDPPIGWRIQGEPETYPTGI